MISSPISSRRLDEEGLIPVITFTPLLELDSCELLDLNNRHAVELSRVAKSYFDSMIRNAFYAQALAPARAFLLAFDQSASYDNVNFSWFRARYERFIYVDRVVVDSACRGQGIARALYEDLFEFARSRQQSLIVCEVNVDPPNLASAMFHKRLGFESAGESLVYHTMKRSHVAAGHTRRIDE
jgi:uncharacterized protein